MNNSHWENYWHSLWLSILRDFSLFLFIVKKIKIKNKKSILFIPRDANLIGVFKKGSQITAHRSSISHKWEIFVLCKYVVWCWILFVVGYCQLLWNFFLKNLKKSPRGYDFEDSVLMNFDRPLVVEDCCFFLLCWTKIIEYVDNLDMRS